MRLNLKVKCPTRSPMEGNGLKAWLTNLHRYVKALPGAINSVFSEIETELAKKLSHRDTISIDDDGNLKVGDNHLYVSSDGKVGVGTDEPAAPLHIISESGVPFIIDHSSDKTWMIQEDGEDRFSLNYNFIEKRMEFAPYNADGNMVRAFMMPSESSKAGDVYFMDGNIGIATDDPASRLDINGAATLRPLSEDPPDPADGRAVFWLSDGTDSGDAGDIMVKINVGGTVKTDTWKDYSAI